MTYAATHGARVAALLGQHLVLVLVSLLIALVIAVPLGVIAARNARAGSVILAVTGALYTIPSLALLALLVAAIGLGQATAIVALVVYAQMILIRGVVAGLRGAHEIGGRRVVLPRRRDAHTERLHRELHAVDELTARHHADRARRRDLRFRTGGHPGHTMLCNSLYAWSPYDPPSRPTPLNLVPPNGVSWLRCTVLIPMLPARSRRPIRIARAESPLNT